MKKIIPFLIVSILLLSGIGAAVEITSQADQTSITTLHFSRPHITQQTTFSIVTLPEATTFSWETGKPMVPIVSQVFTFPFGTQITDVNIQFSDFETYPVECPIEPAPEPQMLSMMSTESTSIISDTLYETIDVYPETRSSYHVGAGIVDHEHVIILSISLFPLEYRPQEHTITAASSAAIEVSYTLPQQPFVFPDEYDLLIIAPAEFETALQRLVDHKNGIGINTQLTTLDEIPATGLDEPESIKYYIKDAIETWGIDYLLLVGAGYEGEELFPNRYAYVPSGGYEQYFPSDLYYADIYDGTGGFSTWDADGDGKHAEYDPPANNDMSAVDIYPDVYMGRLPTNSVDEVNTVIDKIIYYKEHNKMTNEIVQVGGDTFPGDGQSINEGEFANEAVLAVLPGYSTTKLWASNWQLTKANIGSGYRSMPDFFDFSGHGSPQSWATHAPEDENTWLPAETSLSPYTGWLYIDFDIFNVNNAKKFPVVFHNACSNNKYSKAKQSLSWKVLSKKGGGGIAAFGASGIGYGSYGTHEVERLFGWMEVNTHEQMFTIKNLGEAWSNSITDYYNTFAGTLEDADYKTLLEYSMFADPTIRIENGDHPQIYPHNQPVINFLTHVLDYFPRLQAILKQILTN
ncbi:MAG: hypothetical protein KKG04_09815 [Candidatus Thermoplasmatota archaeon]|nr:hypothetical protein [Candidatus Thermoplasmatota archaeon]